MPTVKKPNNNLLDDLEESLKEKPKQYPKKKQEKPIEVKDIIENKQEEPVTLIDSELKRFEKQVQEVLSVLESTNPLSISDVEERLKAVKLKMDIQTRLPSLLTALDDLRNREKLKANQVKGNKDISPLEDGSLD